MSFKEYIGQSHMTWMFPCKIWFRQWNINRWITCRCFLWKPVNQKNFVNLNTYLSIVERKSSRQTWKMYACESSIKYVITHWRVFLLWKQFSQVWYTCRFRESSKRKKYLLCPPILVARDHYMWNGLSDKVVKTRNSTCGMIKIPPAQSRKHGGKGQSYEN